MPATVSHTTQSFPFGEEMAARHAGGDYATRYKFNGKELDPQTGYYYYGARYYDPVISRWLSVDPLAEKYPGLSPYNYTANNPVRMFDPNGKGPEDIIIHGIDGKTLTICAPGDPIHVYLPIPLKKDRDIDIGLNDIQDLAIGYQFTVQANKAAYVGTQFAGLGINVMFFNSEYGRYWYTYAGGEAAIRLEGGGDISISFTGSFFIAVNRTGKYNPKLFAGEYYTGGINPGYKFFGELTLNAQYSWSKHWEIYEFGLGAGVGPSSSIGGIYGGFGGTKLLTPVKKTRDRSWGDILFNQWIYNPLSPGFFGYNPMQLAPLLYKPLIKENPVFKYNPLYQPTFFH